MQGESRLDKDDEEQRHEEDGMPTAQAVDVGLGEAFTRLRIGGQPIGYDRSVASGSGREGTLHLVDFGISTRAGEAVPAGEIYGTPLFASVAAHAGRPTTPMDDIESLCYCLAFLAAGSLPWERRPPERAAALKLGMLAHATDDAPGSSPLDPSSLLLTQDVPGADLRAALRDMWSHVVACRAAPGGEVDYAMCLKALGGEASATAVYDWERASEPIGDRS